MPEKWRFYGIVIRMFFDDHAPPHFHAVYAGRELAVGISPIEVREGSAPARVRLIVLEKGIYPVKQIPTAEALPGRVVRLEYISGESVHVDFYPLIDRGGVFAVLENEDFFQQVTVGEYGRYIEWPGGLDFCADALFERAGSAV